MRSGVFLMLCLIVDMMKRATYVPKQIFIAYGFIKGMPLYFLALGSLAG